MPKKKRVVALLDVANANDSRTIIERTQREKRGNNSFPNNGFSSLAIFYCDDVKGNCSLSFIQPRYQICLASILDELDIREVRQRSSNVILLFLSWFHCQQSYDNDIDVCVSLSSILMINVVMISNHNVKKKENCESIFELPRGPVIFCVRFHHIRNQRIGHPTKRCREWSSYSNCSRIWIICILLLVVVFTLACAVDAACAC